MDTKTKKVLEIIQRYAPKLAQHGVKLSSEEQEKKELEAMALMSEAMLDNGNKIYTPAAEFAEGAEIFTMDENGNSQPLADGDYMTADGITITVVDGKISSMLKPEDMPEAETEVEVEVEQSNEEVAATTVTKEYVDELVGNIVAKFNAETEQKQATINALTKELNDIKAKYNVLSKQAATVSVKQAKTVQNVKPLSEYRTAQERVNAMLFNR